jgi:hypothetical protein
MLSLVAIPGIGLFGYALSQVAILTLLVVGQMQFMMQASIMRVCSSTLGQ